jgi:hypothetical protein
MYFKLMLFCLLFTNHIYSDSGEKYLNGYEAKVDIISEKYEAGPFLIYDCEAGHYVCVLAEYHKDCEDQRAKAIHEKKLEMGCAPIAELPNKKSCFQKQLFLVSQNHGTRFCTGPDWKQKEIEF